MSKPVLNDNKTSTKALSLKLVLISFITACIITASPMLLAKTHHQCKFDTLKADYSISIEHLNQSAQSHPSNSKSHIRQISLWRKKNQVAQQFDHNHISEIWYRSNNKRLQLTRYFDAFSRGIEYQPVDMKSNENTDWQQKSTFISQAFMQSLTYKGPVNDDKGCTQVVKYEKQSSDEIISLYWMPQLKLVKSLTIKQQNQTKTWTLQKTSFDTENINHQFAKWSSYNTTDYADIGDSEDDPFLQKMINMGFSSHKKDGQSAHSGHHH